MTSWVEQNTSNVTIFHFSQVADLRLRILKVQVVHQVGLMKMWRKYVTWSKRTEGVGLTMFVTRMYVLTEDLNRDDLLQNKWPFCSMMTTNKTNLLCKRTWKNRPKNRNLFFKILLFLKKKSAYRDKDSRISRKLKINCRRFWTALQSWSFNRYFQLCDRRRSVRF